MGMNHTRVIRSRAGCWLSNAAHCGWARQLSERTYRHRMVSSNPLIMKANATA
jgi:hypothetical protein